MKYLILILTVSLAVGILSNGFTQVPWKSYYEIRTSCEGPPYTPPFIFDSRVCKYSNPPDNPPIIYFHSNQTLWSCEPIAHQNYYVYATQMGETPEGSPWEMETNHTIIIDSPVDFFHQVHVYSVFPEK